MGKDSLIKSTSKKKTKSANEEETKKKSVKNAAATPKKAAKPKKTKKSPAKTTKAVAAKTTAKKTKSAAAKPKAKPDAAKPKAKTAAAKPSAKKSAAPAKSKAKTKAAAKKTKKATIPELLAKQFDSLPGAPKPKAAAAEKKIFETSPPVISTSDPTEAARIRTLLMTKFSMAKVKAAAKAPEPEKPKAAAVTPEPGKPEAAAPEAPEGETPAAKGVETPAAPADEPPVITTTVVQEDAPEPISRAIKYGIAAMALIVLLLLGISYNNSSKYYIHPKEGAIEIWKGRFSPKDRQFFMVLHGVQLDQEVKAIYSRNDVYPMVFDYYLEKADTLLEVPGLPDFEGIKGYLYQARSYAITPVTKDEVKGRLNSIERMILLYKADVAVSKNTEDSLKAALKDLQKASSLVANPTQQQEIDQKIELVKKLQNELKSMPK
jgi:hypothetical protein